MFSSLEISPVRQTCTRRGLFFHLNFRGDISRTSNSKWHWKVFHFHLPWWNFETDNTKSVLLQVLFLLVHNIIWPSWHGGTSRGQKQPRCVFSEVVSFVQLTHIPREATNLHPWCFKIPALCSTPYHLSQCPSFLQQIWTTAVPQILLNGSNKSSQGADTVPLISRVLPSFYPQPYCLCTYGW